MHGFPHQFLILHENATKPIVWGNPFPIVWVLECFLPIRFPSYGILHQWEMYGFSYQFPIALEKTAKPIKWRKPGKVVPILFP